MRKQGKKLITFVLVFTMIMGIFAPYSYASEAENETEVVGTQLDQTEQPQTEQPQTESVQLMSTQAQAFDELITGFSYRYTKADGTVGTDTVSFATYDTDNTHSQYFDVAPWLEAGTKSVTIFDITKNTDVQFDLVVTPSNYVVDVSSGKGEIKFDATYTDGTTTIRNYYIARFMVNSPFDKTTMTVQSPLAESASTWILENKPVDYFSSTGFWYADKDTWYPGYAGKEFYDSYLFIRPIRDVGSKLDKQSVQAAYRTKFIAEYKAANDNAEPTEEQIAAAIEENASYLYRFTAPADGAILLASNTNTATVTTSSVYTGNYAEIAAAGFTKVAGTPTAATEWSSRTAYTYEQNSFWHAAGARAESFTKTENKANGKYQYGSTKYDITKK